MSQPSHPSSVGVPFSVRWDKLTNRYLVGIPKYEGGMVVPIDGAQQQWRACAKDFRDMSIDASEWLTALGDAEVSLDGLRDSEPPYDQFWIETRWVTSPVSVSEAERAGV